MTDKREQIEAAATRAIQKDGVRNVSFRTLADEVGVKSASVHYHFPTKADLAQAVVRDYSERFGRRLDDIERRHRTLKGKLTAFIRVFEDVLADDNLCLCGMMASEVTALDPATRSELKRFFARCEAWLEERFEHHAAELTSDLAPTRLAGVLMAGLEGALLLDRVDGDDSRLQAFRQFALTLTP